MFIFNIIKFFVKLGMAIMLGIVALVIIICLIAGYERDVSTLYYREPQVEFSISQFNYNKLQHVGDSILCPACPNWFVKKSMKDSDNFCSYECANEFNIWLNKQR